MPRYTDEINAQLLISSLKEAGIRRIIASPGSTNVAFTWSVQNDPFFEVYSSYDERSAAYMACGLAAEAGEPVVISCTGATSSRDYMPGLTEAFYRKLPVMAVESMNDPRDIGNLTTQVLDREVQPRDIARYATRLDIVKDARDREAVRLEVSRAISALSEDGGGPVRVELITENAGSFSCRELPATRLVRRYDADREDDWPEMPSANRILVFIGAHAPFAEGESDALGRFAEKTDAAVLVDSTSGYAGTGAVWGSLAACQLAGNPEGDELRPDLIIHLGEQSGAYDMTGWMNGLDAPIWRVSPDGALRKPFGRLDTVFKCRPAQFFEHYAERIAPSSGYGRAWREYDGSLRASLPGLPFSNPWIAQRLVPAVPAGATVHPSILNSLLSWNFFMTRDDLVTSCNVGGFGIDGCLSTLVGASLARPDVLHVAVLGDLSFFYDMNVLGNRHVGRNLRVLLVNNGIGMTFKQSNHYAHSFGEAGNEIVAAGGHNLPHVPFQSDSPLAGISPAGAWAESLGFSYLSASTKEEFDSKLDEFVSPSDRPVLFECFTREEDERVACDLLRNLDKRRTVAKGAKDLVKSILPSSAVTTVKRALGGRALHR